MTTFTNVLDYVYDNATSDEIDNLYDALKARSKVLRQKIAAAVRVGQQVELGGIRPQYMEGLKGEVIAIDGSWATVRLDPPSTTQLRRKGRKRYLIPAGTDRYEVGGIPLSACRLGTADILGV